MNAFMNRKHPKWKQFRHELNYDIDLFGCKNDTTLAKNLLKSDFPDIDIPKTLAYFEKHGGFCDCEIIFNV